MWLVNRLTGEEGWCIIDNNLYQQQGSPQIVFVPHGGAWKTKLWAPRDYYMRAKTHNEEMADEYDMIDRGFRLGKSKAGLERFRSYRGCKQCQEGGAAKQ